MKATILLALAATTCATVAQADPDPSLQLAKNMYLRQCAVCHGADARGNGPLAPELRRAPSNLRRLAADNGGSFPREATRGYLDGRGDGLHFGREMPVWGAIWEGEGAEALAPSRAAERIELMLDYLKSLQD